MYKLWEVREKVLGAFESKIFSTKFKGAGILNPDHSKLKVLTPKEILQRLPIALVQVKADNNSENLSEIRNQANCLFFVSVKTNHQKSIQ